MFKKKVTKKSADNMAKKPTVSGSPLCIRAIGVDCHVILLSFAEQISADPICRFQFLRKPADESR